MQIIPINELKELHGLLPLLPMLYVGWTNGILSPTEILRLQEYVNSQTWLTTQEQGYLKSWLNPQNPPAEAQRHDWLSVIRDYSDGTSVVGLADFGRYIARRVDARLDEEVNRALEFVEGTLGARGREAIRQLIPQTYDLPVLVESQSPSFNVAQLTQTLDGQHAAFKQRLRQLLTTPQFAYHQSHDSEAYRADVLRWLEQLADQGLGSAAYPAAFGGRDDIAQYLVTMEMLGHHDLSLLVKFGVQFGLFGSSILALGTRHHHERYLAAVGNLQLLGGFGMTESGHGSNVRGLETTATFDAATDEFIIHTPTESARKAYIGNAARDGEMLVVFARLITQGEDYGISPFLVPIRDGQGKLMDGVRIVDHGDKVGLNGVDNGRVSFEYVRIPRENLLNRFADVAADGTYSSPIDKESRRFFTMLGTLVGGRIGIGLTSLSVAKNALTIAIRYANRRRQFGRNDQPETLLIDYKTHQRRLLPPLAQTIALDFALHGLLDQYAASVKQPMQADTRTIETLAAGLKARSSWNATHIVQAAREATGAQGYLAENQLGRLRQDCDIFTTFEGDNTVLMQLVAKERLVALGKEMRGGKIVGVLLRQLWRGIRPKKSHKITSSHLRDSRFHKRLFAAREQTRVLALAKRLQQLVKQGADPTDAQIAAQNDFIRLADALIDRELLAHFLRGVAGTKDPAVRAVLDKLASLFALWQIEQDAAWFMENGYLSRRKSRAIRAEVESLCEELRYQALHVVNGFAIPDALLAAPIGTR